ncbi:carbohydrate ABC transporter permease [Deinococcus aerius]|uniref:carbohydrate ABC transporter permease n=1 Tax=Deinococcus aerius TaxID=200253 RepID=UPI001912ED7F|nr:carbohydrate ABC transporter permease [Deinococcus aerius]
MSVPSERILAPAAPARRTLRPGLRKSTGEKVFDTFNVLLLLALVIVTFYPFYYVVVASLSDPARLAAHEGLLLWPLGFSTDAYRAVWDNPLIRSGYLNTLFYVVVGTALNVLLTCLGAYALTRPGLRVAKPVLLLIIASMFFSGGLIPTFLLVKDLGLLDTRWALILPTAISAWNLLILKTAFEDVPRELEEAARIDGASDLTILRHVYLPLTLPTIAVIALFYAVGHWNSYFSALIYLKDRSLYPLQMVLQEILVANQTSDMMTGQADDRESIAATIKYATIIAATLPILFLYPFLQRYFVKGVMIGGVKE